MLEFTDQVIVLRSGAFREADLWLRLLSPERGLYTAFAFGGSKSRKRFAGCLDLFNEVRFQVRRGGTGRRGPGGGSGGGPSAGPDEQFLVLQEGLLLRGPERLRRDWRRLGLAVNCALFLEAFCRGQDESASVYRLFAGLLNTLEEAENLSELLPIFFRARLAFEQGYAVGLGACSVCGRDLLGGAFLPPSFSGLICADCARRQIGHAYLRSESRLGPEALEVLRRIMDLQPEGWSALPQGLDAQKECARVVDAFLRQNTGLRWQNGRFRAF